MGASSKRLAVVPQGLTRPWPIDAQTEGPAQVMKHLVSVFPAESLAKGNQPNVPLVDAQPAFQCCDWALLEQRLRHSRETDCVQLDCALMGLCENYLLEV